MVAARVSICLILVDSIILNESNRTEVRSESWHTDWHISLMNNALRDRKAVAEIKVDAQGHGLPLRVGDRDFQF